MSSCCVYPKFSSLGRFGFRFGGPGLGNLLFIYARSLVLAQKFGLRLINPTWPTFKIGPILRAEKDKRNYRGLFLKSGISGWEKIKILSVSRRLTEEKFLRNPSVFSESDVVLVEGLDGYFKDLMESQPHIRSSFLNIVREEVKGIAASVGSAEIGVHVRLGDFHPAARVSLDWYADMISRIRVHLPNARINIFTDGKPAEISKLLELSGTRLISLNNPLAELLALSACGLILGSNSTFGAWAAFLGKTPVIWGGAFSEIADDLNKLFFSRHLSLGEEIPIAAFHKIRQSPSGSGWSEFID